MINLSVNIDATSQEAMVKAVEDVLSRVRKGDYNFRVDGAKGDDRGFLLDAEGGESWDDEDE